MTEKISYLILGAGAQGTAAAYDMVRFDGTAEVVLADAALPAARAAPSSG